MRRASPMEARRCELYADIEDSVSHTLKVNAIPDNAADSAAAAVVDMLSMDWAGQNLTFPRGQMQARDREADILARMGPVSVAELAKEYGISERAVRKAYHRARNRRQQSRKGGEP